eukprot:2243325-Alexandrium_andersonii.AAC.1
MPRGPGGFLLESADDADQLAAEVVVLLLRAPAARGEPRGRPNGHGHRSRVSRRPANAMHDPEGGQGHGGGPSTGPRGRGHAPVEAGPQGPVH